MQTKEVATSVGTFIIRRPNAGMRNKSMIASESEMGVVKQTVFMTNLLPKCIVQRPTDMDKDTPIEDILNELDPEDYDLLFSELNEISLTSFDKVEEKKTQSVSSLKQVSSQNQQN